MNIAKSSFNLLEKLLFAVKNRRLRSKLFLVYMLVTILPISFLIMYSYHTVKDQLIRQAVDNVGSTIDQINNNIENKLDLYTQNATLLYMDTQLRNYLLTRYGKKDLSYLDAYDYINKSLYKILAINPNLKSITIYTDNETLHSDGLFIKHWDQLPGQLIAQTLDAKGQITQFYPDASPEQGRVVTLARSLNYLSLNYPYGILTMEISEREIYSLIEKENRNKTIAVVDEKGRIITSGVKNANLRTLSDLVSDEPGVPFAAAKDSARFGSMAGERVIVMEKETANGWRTVVILPYEQLIAQARSASAKMLFISLACVGAAIIMIYATSQLMTKRLETLLQQIRKVERGVFQVSFPPMGNDEVGQLSFALRRMAATIQGLIQDVAKKETLRNEAEMTSLQAQITPHFLYNTLASISALSIQKESGQAHRMADDLARFYRISLSKGKKSIPIEQEIRLTEHYLSIQSIRFQQLFHVHYVLDESLFRYTTLKLIVQPFIENCLNHALWDEEGTSGINIVIKLAEDGEDLLISVIDDGIGIHPKTLHKLRERKEHPEPEGYGIYNVDRRIKLAYGEQYGVEIFSRLGAGTSVRIRFPKTMPG